jgi:pimeloyl-ACP methyl ester carboxylesterase
VRRRRWIALTVAGALCVLAVAPLAAAAPDDCPTGFACSRVRVPLDRSTAQSPTLDLLMARQAGATGRTPLLALAGGPGQAAVRFAPSVARELGVAASRYQVVAFDQRGTGGSGALRCPALQRAGESPSLDVAAAATAACGTALGAAAGDYATAATVEDIEAVRVALRADKIALLGVSYGTHVIQRYLLAHPEHVGRVVLDSTVAPGGVDALQLASYGALPRVLGAQSKAAVGQTARLVRRVAGAALRGRVVGPSGHRRAMAIGQTARLFDIYVSGDQSALLRTQYPAAVSAALHGDATPLLRLNLLDEMAPNPPTAQLSAGLFAATTCTDTAMPWTPGSYPATRRPQLDASLASVPAAAIAPLDRSSARETSVSGACLGWPPTATVPDAAPDAYAAVPALILSGLADVRTPLESARAVAAKLPGAQLLTVAGTGHDVLDSDTTGCVATGLVQFLLGRTVTTTACRRSNGLDRAVGRFPTRIGQLRATGGHGRPARALTAALASAQDALDVAVTLLDSGMAPRFGGLRGGTLRARLGDGGNLVVALRRYTFVPGLHVSGTVRVDRRKATARLTLGGAATGRVRIDGGRRTATIGGHHLGVRARGEPSAHEAARLGVR